MLELLIPTLLTSAVDSLNPIAITQQFILQGMVKKPSHLWYFIVAVACTNIAAGYLAYYGLIGLLTGFFSMLYQEVKTFLFIGELVLGIAFIVFAFFVIFRKSKEKAEDNDDEQAIAKKIKSVKPLSLVLIGFIATVSELTSALPYFAFLAIISTHTLNFIEVTVLFLIYNFIYCVPFFILYFIYIKAQSKFDSLYHLLKKYISKFSNILAPLLLFLIGGFLIYHAISIQ